MIGKIYICESSNEAKVFIDEMLAGFWPSKRVSDVLRFCDGEDIGVEEAFRIRNFFNMTPFEGLGRAVVIEGCSISEIAQNALLKTFEELKDDDTVIITAPSTLTFIPTLFSRLELIFADRSLEEKVDLSRVLDFYQMSMEYRFAFIEKLEDRDSFLDEIFKFATMKVRGSRKWIEFGRDALKAKEFKEAHGNTRAILEWLALKLPYESK